MTDAIILAAGNSKRFGKDNKLFTDFNSTLLITHVVSEICKSKLRNIIVITGKDHVKINKLLKKFRVQVIKNLRFNEGINSSISLGIKKSFDFSIASADSGLKFDSKRTYQAPNVSPFFIVPICSIILLF